ncbi:RNA-guided endonuclease InsQ/TnpB family protein [Nonomuraea sp. 3N208]|uniref:RNA-guided endonuclease InsQ/TnpB family protein n=1 Tax=Nonomuraea sp. 3N208 TaxID=3457421 RepID=UPI003FD6B32F
MKPAHLNHDVSQCSVTSSKALLLYAVTSTRGHASRVTIVLTVWIFRLLARGRDDVFELVGQEWLVGEVLPACWRVGSIGWSSMPDSDCSLSGRHAGENGVSWMAPPPVKAADGPSDTGFLATGEARRYKRLQRRLARAKKSSNRRRRVVRAMGDLLRRARWRRADFNAQAAHRLTRDNAIVTLEKLNIRAMTASVAPKPDPGKPGAYLANGRAAKAGLNRSILGKGWYGLEVALRSKARYTGTDIRVVDPAYTSQTCSNPVCGTVDGKSRESQADFRCTSCGHVEHADVIAAKNIKTRGHAAGLVVSGRGDPTRSVKRQAPRTTARGASTAPRAAA